MEPLKIFNQKTAEGMKTKSLTSFVRKTKLIVSSQYQKHKIISSEWCELNADNNHWSQTESLKPKTETAKVKQIVNTESVL